MNERSANVLYQRAYAAVRHGHHKQAVAAAREALNRNPEHVGAAQVLAASLGAMGRYQDVVDVLRPLLQRRPDIPGLWLNIATALGRLHHHQDALEACRQAIQVAPREPTPRVYLAFAQRDAGQLDHATETVRETVARGSLSPDLSARCAALLLEAGCAGEALDLLEPALTRDVAATPAWIQAAEASMAMGDAAQARRYAERAVDLSPGSTAVWSVRLRVEASESTGSGLATVVEEAARALGEQHVLIQRGRAWLAEARGRDREAARAWQGVLAREPGDLDALRGLTALQIRYADGEAAEATVRQGLFRNPGDPFLRRLLANALSLLGRREEALEQLESLLDEMPGDDTVRHMLLHVRQFLCDWDGLERDLAAMPMPGSADDQNVVGGLDMLAILALPISPETQFSLLSSKATEIRQSVGAPASIHVPEPQDGRLRIGYLSPDFREHASMHLAADVFGRHDRQHVEVFAYSIGPSGENDWRSRVAESADVFRDFYGVPDSEVVDAIRADRVHIVVDAGGHTRYARPELLACRLAPVQVGWLAYPGSMAGDWLDYYIGDPWVTPESVQRHFSESMVHMPGYYVPTRPGSAAEPCEQRAAHGLPENGIVYVCFNAAYKLSRGVFRRWMAILHQVSGSVLWLMDHGPEVSSRLRAEAVCAGVDPQRLVFAPRLERPRHLARLALADLFLDTPYYNAHTTGVDALEAGVPLITVPGETLAARVGTSLLQNVGLDDGILPDWNAYEHKAVALGQDAEQLSSLRQRLHEQRWSSRLFDQQGYVRALEWAYHALWQCSTTGERPPLLEVPVDAMRSGPALR